MSRRERVNTSRVCPACRGSKFVNDKRCGMCAGAGQLPMIPGMDAHRTAPVVDESTDNLIDRILQPTAPLVLRRSSIQDAWNNYERLVVPASAGHGQRKEIRFVWYTAIAWFLDMTMLLDEGTEPTDADMAYMTSIQHEIEEFVDAFKRGEA